MKTEKGITVKDEVISLPESQKERFEDSKNYKVPLIAATIIGIVFGIANYIVGGILILFAFLLFCGFFIILMIALFSVTPRWISFDRTEIIIEYYFPREQKKQLREIEKMKRTDDEKLCIWGFNRFGAISISFQKDAQDKLISYWKNARNTI